MCLLPGLYAPCFTFFKLHHFGVQWLHSQIVVITRILTGFWDIVSWWDEVTRYYWVIICRYACTFRIVWHLFDTRSLMQSANPCPFASSCLQKVQHSETLWCPPFKLTFSMTYWNQNTECNVSLLNSTLPEWDGSTIHFLISNSLSLSRLSITHETSHSGKHCSNAWCGKISEHLQAVHFHCAFTLPLSSLTMPCCTT